MRPKTAPKLDCIIPFYNEGTRVMSVIETVLQSSYIGHGICVDDGSTDVVGRLPQHKKLIHIRHPKNAGKAAAIRSGLEVVATDYVCLLDADLIGLTGRMLDTLIRYMQSARPDMLIIRCQKTLPTTRLLGLDVVFGGVRIVRTQLLRQALHAPVKGYQIEPAMNAYVTSNQTKTAYVDLPIMQYRKKDKHGLIKGIYLDLMATREVIRYRGFWSMARQIVTFKPQHVHIRDLIS